MITKNKKLVGNFSGNMYFNSSSRYVFLKLLEYPGFVEDYKSYLHAINDPDSEENLFDKYLYKWVDESQGIMGEFYREIEKNFPEEKNV